MRVKDKVVILIGADEVGFSLAKGLTKEGAKLVIGDEKKDKAEIAAREVNAVAIECDITKNESVRQIVDQTLEKFGRIDALVNNVWTNKLCSFTEMTEKLWDEIIDKNLTGAFRCARAVVPTMKKQGRGRIVQITSLSGLSGSEWGEVHFCTSQAALMGFIRCLARELGGSNIYANAISTAPMECDSYFQTYSRDRVEATKVFVALGRLCKPEDVVEPVLFLLSDDNNFVTGEILSVGGGLYMR